MSYRLLILGVLAEQPHYGYDLKQTIARQHYAEYIRLSGGGLYYHLRKLREEGYIEEQMVEREGNYPDRHIYQITERGRSYLIELLRATLDDVAGRRVYDPLDAAFSFAFLLPNEEVLARLQHQLDVVQGQLSALTITQQIHRRIITRTAGRASSPAKRESFHAQLMLDHNLAFLRHEVSWLQETIHEIEEQSNSEDRSMQRDPDIETSLSRQIFIDEYAQFEHAHAVTTEALARYRHEVELTWQEYQRLAVTGSNSELGQARKAYQQRIVEAREVYEKSIRHLQEKE
jgi:DNA-binding PadR family transcriptional regulator